MADGSDHNWHWRKNPPPKQDTRKGFFSNLAATIRAKGPAPDRASFLARRISIWYAFGAWTLCFCGGVVWYFHYKNKPISDEAVSSMKSVKPSKEWSKKTPFGTFSVEEYKASDANPNMLQVYKRRIKAKFSDWWNTDDSIDEKDAANNNKGTT